MASASPTTALKMPNGHVRQPAVVRSDVETAFGDRVLRPSPTIYAVMVATMIATDSLMKDVATAAMVKNEIVQRPAEPAPNGVRADRGEAVRRRGLVPRSAATCKTTTVT